MAAITPVAQQLNGYYPSLRTAAAQATTGQTDWLVVPAWARAMEVYFNLTANAGTSPISTLSLVAPPPGVFDDTDLMTIGSGAAVTAASQHRYNVGPGIASGADQAAADANAGIDTLLPATLVGIKVLNDRTTGDETYTYTLAVRFIS